LHRSHRGRNAEWPAWDNATAESFFATLKNGMYYRPRFDTRAKARFAVAEYMRFFTTASGSISATSDGQAGRLQFFGAQPVPGDVDHVVHPAEDPEVAVGGLQRDVPG
jgi:hypothetical protein